MSVTFPSSGKIKWNEGGGEGVVGLHRAKKGVQDKVLWTSALPLSLVPLATASLCLQPQK